MRTRTCRNCSGNGSRDIQTSCSFCGYCNGTGVVIVKMLTCPECEGHGRYQLEDCGEFFECEGCGGAGEIEDD